MLAMNGWSISEVAGRAGLRPSTLRYYEAIGVLPAAQRQSGQRRYDAHALYWLAVVQRARQVGFSLNEIRQLFFGFRDAATASERWRTLSARKLAELDAMLDRVKAMQKLLRKMQRCQCATLEQCGKGMFEHACERTRR